MKVKKVQRYQKGVRGRGSHACVTNRDIPWFPVFPGSILSFLCYANEESDDVVNCATKMVKYSIKNIS